jgi:hypothetical protein
MSRSVKTVRTEQDVKDQQARLREYGKKREEEKKLRERSKSKPQKTPMIDMSILPTPEESAVILSNKCPLMLPSSPSEDLPGLVDNSTKVVIHIPPKEVVELSTEEVVKSVNLAVEESKNKPEVKSTGLTINWNTLDGRSFDPSNPIKDLDGKIRWIQGTQPFKTKSKAFFLIYLVNIEKNSIIEALKKVKDLYSDTYPIISHNTGVTFVFARYKDTVEKSKENVFDILNNRPFIYSITAAGEYKNVENFVKVSDELYKPEVADASKVPIYDRVKASTTDEEVLRLANRPGDAPGLLTMHQIALKNKMKDNPMIEYWKNYKPWGWQKIVMKLVSESPNDRDIIWVYGRKPKVGKTNLSEYLEANYPKHFLPIPNPGQLDNVQRLRVTSYLNGSWNGYCTILNFQMGQEHAEHIYKILEAVKDPRISSGKYEPISKSTPYGHVLVFANFPPNPYRRVEKKIPFPGGSKMETIIETLIDPNRLKVINLDEFTNDPNLKNPNPDYKGPALDLGVKLDETETLLEKRMLESIVTGDKLMSPEFKNPTKQSIDIIAESMGN